MASELRVNTLKDASGNNSVATSTVAQGSAKAWMHSDFSTLQASFNASSLADTGSGDNGINYTNNMSSANYSVGVKSQPTSGNDTNLNSIVKFNSQTSAVVNGQAGNVAGALFDCPAIYITVHGDLA